MRQPVDFASSNDTSFRLGSLAKTLGLLDVLT